MTKERPYIFDRYVDGVKQLAGCIVYDYFLSTAREKANRMFPNDVLKYKNRPNRSTPSSTRGD